jgi:hypothetical protein
LGELNPAYFALKKAQPGELPGVNMRNTARKENRARQRSENGG